MVVRGQLWNEDLASSEGSELAGMNDSDIIILIVTVVHGDKELTSIRHFPICNLG